LYSRITAAKITRPLAKLCDGTRLLREGDYSVRVDLRLKNEFAQLQDTFNAMAEKIQREMALRKKSEEDRRRLILDISHDLKTPLASISGYGELCLGKPDLSAQEREKYLGVILTNSQRANRLLGELFELSQLDSPGFALRQEPTDLGEALRQACAEMIPALEEAGFDYDFEIPQEEIWVRLDVHRFQRIVQNLADNALRYNPKGTKVTVSLRQEGQEARVLFEDNGRGIPPLLAREIFKPFVRAEESRNSTSGGSGLGLSIARGIARAHGGDLTLDSDEGRGSRFLLSLPLM
jgi:signal transduction histidine kinase